MSLVSVRLAATVLALGSQVPFAQVPFEDAPSLVVSLGERLGCLVPSGQLPGVVTAWVVEREAGTGTAYVAWCRRQGRGDAMYDLVVATSKQHPWASCPSHARLGMPAPFPHLRATMLPKDLPYPMKLNEFGYLQGDNYYLLEDRSRVFSSGVPTGPALDFGMEDAGQIILCLGDRWIIGGYH